MEEQQKEMQIVEIGGKRFEIAVPAARQIEEFRVGDNVKVLMKYYSEYKVHPGVIAGFDYFKNLPTVNVAVFKSDAAGGGGRVEMVAINASTKDTEITHSDGTLSLSLDKATVLQKMERDILNKEQELRDAKASRDFFLANFGRFFGEGQAPGCQG